MLTINNLSRLLAHPEGQNLEFKSARNQFSRDKDLPDYCAALANEGGGKLILGVDNNKQIVGTKAFLGTHQTLSHYLLQRLGIRVDVEEIRHSDGRILIFLVHPHYPGKPVKSNGTHWMRAGESLVPMDDQTLYRILSEMQPDFSAQIVTGTKLIDLDPGAIAVLRKLCYEKSTNSNYKSCTDKQLLRDLGLLVKDDITYAGLVLLGKQEVLQRLIPHAKIIFEWKQIAGKIHHDYRTSWQKPFLTIFDQIWEEINKRNLVTPYREGFIQREIKAFDQTSVREAILNAVAHRDYQQFGSVIFIYASPEGIKIESCLLYTSPSPRDRTRSRMPSSA